MGNDYTVKINTDISCIKQIAKLINRGCMQNLSNANQFSGNTRTCVTCMCRRRSIAALWRLAHACRWRHTKLCCMPTVSEQCHGAPAQTGLNTPNQVMWYVTVSCPLLRRRSAALPGQSAHWVEDQSGWRAADCSPGWALHRREETLVGKRLVPRTFHAGCVMALAWSGV